MANAPAFSLQGSTPNVFANTSNNTSTPSTPAAKALNNKSNLSSIAGGIGNALNTAKNIIPNIVGNEYKAIGNAASGAYNYLTAPSGTSYAQANPTQPFQYTGILGNQSPQPTAQPTVQATSQPTAQTNPQSGILPATQQNNATTYVNPNAGQFGTGAASTQPTVSTPSTSATTANTNGQVTYPGLIQQQAQFDPFSNPSVAGAYKSAQDINAQIAQSKLNQANGEKTLLTQAIPLGDSQGQAQVFRNQSLAQQNALSSELQGQTNIYNAGFTGTGQQLSGLNSAASNAAPQLGSIGQVPFNPLTQGQGAVLGSTQPGGVAAAGNLLGQFQGAQSAGSALGGVQASQTQQVEGYKSALQQGKNLQSQLTDLISTFGLNPNDLNAANIGIQKIAQNVSSPQYKILANYVNDIANTYSQILTPPGGSATDTTRGIAASMLDATASGTSLLSVMQSLDQAAQAKIAGVQTAGNSNNNSSGSTVGWY